MIFERQILDSKLAKLKYHKFQIGTLGFFI